jgi:hypothetical protein
MACHAWDVLVAVALSRALWAPTNKSNWNYFDSSGTEQIKEKDMRNFNQEIAEILLERRHARRINRAIRARENAIERGDFSGTQLAWNRLSLLQAQRRQALGRLVAPATS